jgi:hypothetical protein
MMQPMEYEVRNKQVEEMLRDLGHKLKDAMPPGCGFSLLIFGFSPDNELFYLSSAQLKDMIRTMREFVAKFGEN